MGMFLCQQKIENYVIFSQGLGHIVFCREINGTYAYFVGKQTHFFRWKLPKCKITFIMS